MIVLGPTDLRLSSGSPWHLELNVEPIGNDYLCRIHGGDRHIGAVTLSQWRSGGVVTESLAVSRHKEGAITTDAAHLLCAASRRSVSCIAGIHFDSLSESQIEEIVEAVQLLTRQAARALEDRRLAAEASPSPQ